MEVTQPRGLRDQALDAASQGIAPVPVVGGLLGPEPLLGLLLAARQEGHVPGVVLGAGAAGPVGAGATVWLPEGGPNDWQAVAAAGGLPVAADLAGGADDVASVVVDGEAGEVERVVVAGLPAGAVSRGQPCPL
jgi:hypothetical protein